MPSSSIFDSLLGGNGGFFSNNSDNSDRLTYYDRIQRTRDLALTGYPIN